MRKLILFLVVFIPFITEAQTQTDLDNAGQLLLAKKYKDALPVFQKIMAGSDETLKRRTIDFLTDVWVNHTNEVYMTLSGEIKGYATLLMDYTQATFAGKESTMNTADHYTAGMLFWALGSSGIKTDVIRALTQLNLAYKGGNKKAAAYFAEALASYKRDNPSYPWGEVLQAHARAVQETHSLKQLQSFGWNHYTNVSGWLASDSKTERDTSRLLFFETLNITAGVLPDSLYRMIDYYRVRSFNPDWQDTVMVRFLDDYTAQIASVPQLTPALRKAYAWNQLYKFFYDLSPKTDEIRADLMKKMKAVYANDDKALIEVISLFLIETNVNAAGYAMSLNSKWTKYFSPAKLNDPGLFYYAAAASDADMTAFIPANGPIENYVRALTKGYNQRLFILNAIINSPSLNTQAKSALGQSATMDNIVILKELLSLPALAKSGDLKHAYADMSVMNNYAYAINYGQVPVQIGDLPAVFSGWTQGDKDSYDAKYFNNLAAVLNQIKTSAPVSDLDYSRLTNAMTKLAAVFKK